MAHDIWQRRSLVSKANHVCAFMMRDGVPEDLHDFPRTALYTIQYGKTSRGRDWMARPHVCERRLLNHNENSSRERWTLGARESRKWKWWAQKA